MYSPLSSGLQVSVCTKSFINLGRAEHTLLQGRARAAPEVLRWRFQQLHGLKGSPKLCVRVDHLVRNLAEDFGLQCDIW